MDTYGATPSAVLHTDIFKDIVDNLPSVIFVKDSSLHMVYVNKACAQRVGKPSHEIIGKSDIDLFPEAEAKVFLERDTRIMGSDAVDYTEEETNDHDGVLRVWGTTKKRFLGPDGKHYMLGGQKDITAERGRMAEYQSLTDTAPVGIWRVDGSGKTRFVNDLFLSFMGLERQNATTDVILARLPLEHRNALGKECQFEADLIFGKTPRRVHVMCSAPRQVPGYVHTAQTVCMIDLSDMQELQRINDDVQRLNRELATNFEKLRQAQDETIRNGKLAQLGELTATIAHELRNPLGAVRTSAFLIERMVKDSNPKLVGPIDRINKGVTRCDAIITQLLDFARSKPAILKDEALDEWLENLVREQVEHIPPSVAIELELGLADRKVAFDAAQMSRVFINLISNAAEAMVGKADIGEKPASNPDRPPLIRICTGSDAQSVWVAVTDNGPGIAPENMAKILQPLFTTKSFGTGLGLPAVQKILELHRGGLAITSKPGDGATFKAHWPLQIVELESASDAA